MASSPCTFLDHIKTSQQTLISPRRDAGTGVLISPAGVSPCRLSCYFCFGKTLQRTNLLSIPPPLGRGIQGVGSFITSLTSLFLLWREADTWLVLCPPRTICKYKTYYRPKGTETSAAKMPGSFCKFKKPWYFSSSNFTRLSPKPWSPRLVLI